MTGSDQNYELLFERNLAGVYRTTLSGDFLYCNRAFAAILGFENPEEVLCHKAWEFYLNRADREELIARLREQGTLTNVELELRRKDGRTIWVMGNISFLRGVDGKPVMLGGTVIDITEGKQAEEALRQSEDRYRSLVENAKDAIYTLSVDGTITSLNRAFEVITGFQREEWIGKPFAPIIHRDDLPLAIESLRNVMEGGTGHTYEMRVLSKSGGYVVGEFSPTPQIQNGRVIGILGIARDVTDRKRAEEALCESQQRYKSLIESARDVIYTLSPDGILTSLNPAFEGLTGFDRDEWIGRPFTPLVHPDDLPLAMSLVSRLLNAEAVPTIELRILSKSGEYIVGEFSPTAQVQNGRVVSILGIARDVTDRKQAEEALKESEARFRAVAETATCAIAIYQGDKFRYVNQATEIITGYSREELLAISFWDLAHPDFREMIRERGLARQRGEQIVSRYDYKIVTKGGEERWVNTSAGLIEFEGKSAGLSTTYDITERKRAEEALAAEKERLAVTLGSIGDGVIATDNDGRVVLINKVGEELTGYSQEMAAGGLLDDVFDVIDEKTRKKSKSPVDTILATGRVVGPANHTVLIARDGTERIIADSGAPIRDARDRIIGVVLVFRDITEKLKTEEELLKASKLESVGVLAGGIAHDFNNILTAILGNISLAKMHVGPEDIAYSNLVKAEQASLRAKDLTQQLLAFSKGGAPIKKTTSINELVKDSAMLALTGSNVRCEYHLSESVWPVDVDEGQMSQVIHNLVLNAQQATPEGGTIKLRSENLTPRTQNASTLPLEGEKYVKISIEDNGIGMPEEYLSKIFDPYFTTKQKGSGLGLATSYAIIKNHDGHITVDSKLGAGTTFDIYLPASRKAIRSRHAPPETSVAGKGTVLVMDDEEIIRIVTAEMLTMSGYDVAVACDGVEAVELYTRAMKAGRAFDAVILDLTVAGGLGGKETVKRLLELDPDLKAIVSSGYSNDPVMAHFKSWGFRGVVAKPYRIEELRKVLDKVIGGAGD